MSDGNVGSPPPVARRPVGSWRAKRRDSWLTSRRARRLVAAAFVIGLVTAFAWLLLEPLGRPKAALIGLRPVAGDRAALPWGERDFTAIAEATAARLLEPPTDLSSSLPPAELFGQRLRDVAPDSDVLLLYVQAEAVSIDGRPVLLWGSAAGETEPRRYPLRDVLAGLSAHPAATKVLFLDAVTPGPDRWAGRIDEAFPQGLADACREVGEDVWVMTSHDGGQRGHVSRSLDRSVFGYWLGRGLAGSADRDRDGDVRLRELQDYVGAAVGQWVHGTTDGREQQTPRLFACGPNGGPQADPFLVPAPRWFRRERESDALRHALAAAKKERDAIAAEAMPATRSTNGRGEAAAAPAPAVADATSTADPEKAATVSRPLSGEELLNLAWNVRDDVEQGATPRPDPRRDQPHLWRAFVDRLLELEKHVAGGSTSQRETAEGELLRLALPLSRWAAGGAFEPDAAEPVRSLITPRPAEPHWFAGSLALEEARAAESGKPIPEDVKTVIETYDRIAAGGSRDELAKWLAELTPDQQSSVEVRLAARLAALPWLDALLFQEMLATRRQAERVATTREAALWLPEAVERADTLRRAAENLLLQEVGANRQELAGQLIAEARRRYDAASADVTAIREAESLRIALFDFAPHLIDWHRETQMLAGPRNPSSSDSLALLGATEELTAALDAPGPEGLPRLKAATAHAQALFATVRAGLEPAYVQKTLLTPPDPADDFLRLQALLATSLLPGSERSDVRGAARRAEESLATAISYDPPRAVPRSSASGELRERLRTRIELECRLAKLTVPAASADLLRPLFESAAATTAGLGGERLDLRPFEAALSEFWQRTLPALAMPSTVTESSPVAEVRFAALRGVDRAVRLIDPRDALRLPAFPLARLRTESVSRSLAWQARRADLDRREALGDAGDTLRSLAASYRDAATMLSGHETVQAGDELLRIEGGTGVSLESVESTTFELTAVNASAAPADVWFVIDYDPTIISVESTSLLSSAWRLKKQIDDPDAAVADPETLNRPDVRGDEPSFRLPPQSRRVVSFHVKRRSGSGQPTRVIVRGIARTTGADGRHAATSLARHDISVALPSLAVAELLVEGPPGTVGEGERHHVVTPFPNRITPYRLLLAGTTQAATAVDVSLFALRSNQAAFGALPALDDIPTGIGLESAAAANLLDDWTDGAALFSVNELSLPADGTAVALPFPKPLPPAPNAVAPAAEQGLLVVVTDRATGRRSLYPIAVRPQHPRRYLEPHVRYNANAQRIDITVEPRDLTLMPPGGSRVSCEVVEPLPAEATRKLAGAVTADGTPASLFVETAGARLDAVTLRLTVDDYPRAFLYRVPLSGSRSDLTPETGVSRVRILAPEPGTPFRSPIARIPVSLEVDAPIGTRWDAGDAVVLGLDRDRDRELRGEESIRLFSDRRIAVTVQELAPGGLISLGTAVTDFQIDLPADHVARGRVNVLGCLVTGGRVTWSAPVEVTIDDVPPLIARLRLSRRQVVAGEPLRVTAETSDGNLSGVAQVLTGVDLERAGEFGPTAKPVAAVREQGRWIATLDTAKLLPGPYYVLARAVDAVGNPGPYARERIEVVTPEQIAAARAAAVNDVSGFVQYRGRPMAGFEVTLEPVSPTAAETPQTPPPAPAPPIPPVMTDAQGAFTIRRVPPGPYRVTAAGVYNNRRRTGAAEVIVPPAPDETPPVEIPVDPRPSDAQPPGS